MASQPGIRYPFIWPMVVLALAVGACQTAAPTTVRRVVVNTRPSPRIPSPSPPETASPGASPTASPTPSASPSTTPTPAPSPDLVSTFAGSASGSAGFVDGTGTQALFRGPTAIAADAHGNLFVCDTGNDAIREIDASGTVTTVAGLGAANAGSADGGKDVASFKNPYGIAVGTRGVLYVADRDNQSIRRIDPSRAATDPAYVSTLAGGALAGYQDGAAKSTLFSYPSALCFDGQNTLYVADAGNFVVRALTLGPAESATSTTLAGGLANSDGSTDGSADGIATDAQFEHPLGMAIASGALYVVDSGEPGLRRIDLATRQVSTVASGTQGTDGDSEPLPSVKFSFPSDVVLGPDGTLYLSDTENDVVRAISPDRKTITRFVGQMGTPGTRDGGYADALLNQPDGLVIVGDSLYVVDTTNNNIRRIKLP